MHTNKLAIVILLAFAATATAAKDHPLENKPNESWQVRYHKDAGGVIALQMQVSLVKEVVPVFDNRRVILVKLAKYEGLDATETKYVASPWGGTNMKTIPLVGWVDDIADATGGKIKRKPLQFSARGYYNQSGITHEVTVSGFVMRNKTKGNDKDLRVAVRLRDKEQAAVVRVTGGAPAAPDPCEKEQSAPLQPRPQVAMGRDGSDPCEGVSTEDILEEGTYVDPVGATPFEYEPTYPMP